MCSHFEWKLFSLHLLFSNCFFSTNFFSLSPLTYLPTYLLAFNSPPVHCSMVGAVNNTVPFGPRHYSRVPIIRAHPLLSLSFSLSLSLHYVYVIASEASQLLMRRRQRVSFERIDEVFLWQPLTSAQLLSWRWWDRQLNLSGNMSTSGGWVLLA